MTTLTVPVVTGWRPGGLAAAADELRARAESVADDARAVRRHLGDAVDDAGGVWATTAASRADQEARRGEALADALSAAASALLAGAETLAQARDALLAAVERARAGGFGVADTGRLLAPQPPDSVPPAERLGWHVAPEQLEEARRTAAERVGHETEIAAALAAAAAADDALARALGDLSFPATLPSLVAAHGLRTRLLGGDPVAALGTAGGAVVVGRAVSDGVALARDGRRLGDYVRAVRSGTSGDELERARRAVAHGTAHNPVLRLVGRASMPLTVATGVHDAVTGGGYDGARGWATRGFGAAGATGAVLVMTAAPPLVVVGGAAVLAYGAWSAGSYVVDHWDQVDAAAETAGDWLVDEVTDEAAAAAEALDWAAETLSAGADGILGELF